MSILILDTTRLGNLFLWTGLGDGGDSFASLPPQINPQPQVPSPNSPILDYSLIAVRNIGSKLCGLGRVEDHKAIFFNQFWDHFWTTWLRISPQTIVRPISYIVVNHMASESDVLYYFYEQ